MITPDVKLVAELLHEGLAQGQMPFLTVTSNSMSPLLRRGDQVGLVDAALEDLNPGDVIVVQDHISFTTHRYWATIENDGQKLLLTRGDRPLAFDPLWNEDQYVGRVLVRRRKARFLPLDRGTGHWLNRHLKQLARLEVGLFDRPALSVRPSSDRSFSRRLLRRLLRSTFHAYATLVAAICTLLGAKPESRTHYLRLAGTDNDQGSEL